MRDNNPDKGDGQMSIYDSRKTGDTLYSKDVLSNYGIEDPEQFALPDPILRPKEDIQDAITQISSGPEVIELSKEYDDSRHTLPMDNSVYIVLERLMKRYKDRGSVVNALLSYSLTKLEEGEIVLRDGDQESSTLVLNKFYHTHGK